MKVYSSKVAFPDIYQFQSGEETQTVAVTVLQGLATGTLLYVVFFEVIEKERLKGTSGMVQVSVVQHLLSAHIIRVAVYLLEAF